MMFEYYYYTNATLTMQSKRFRLISRYINRLQMKHNYKNLIYLYPSEIIQSQSIIPLYKI